MNIQMMMHFVVGENMKKRGFTLIELLAVITILGIIAVIITPVVTGILSKAEEDAYKKQVDNIVKAAQTWGLRHIDELSINDKKTIQLDTLIGEGFIENSDIINPKTNERMEGCISITYSEEYKQYEYKYISDNNLCK